MLRNKEIRQSAVIFLSIAIGSSLLLFFIHPAAGTVSLVAALAYGVLFYRFTKARYQKISALSDQIDHMLHNAGQLSIQDAEEGELSILQSEIQKMTLRIREQNDALKCEKAHLADSLADIAHQLRTPLTSANLTLSLLENNPDDARKKALIRETKELFFQMDWLLTALLKLSRLDAGIVIFQTERIMLASLINAALSPLFIPMELRGIALRMEMPKGAVLSADLNWLSEAIRNILKNCMDSAGDQGTIEILCEDNVLYTEIAIHDNGRGFEPEELPRLFERFYRGKNTETAGYGIGLSLSKMIILRQGGTIQAKNHPRGGALFLIRFPK